MTVSENSPSEDKNPFGSAAYGLFLILLSLAIFYFAGEIRSRHLGENDPGPRALPIATGIILLVGGIGQICVAFFKEGLWKQFRTPGRERRTDPPGTKRGVRAMLVLLLFGAYITLLNVVGFALASAIFLLVTLKLLGSSWLEAILSTLTLIVLIWLMFQRLFQVSLPTGVLF